MFDTLRSKWAKWRESRRQYAIERALDKAERGKAGDDHPDIRPPPPSVP
jgi:hypothetical protein